MASAATTRTPNLGQHDWLRAARERLDQQGVEAVRVEALARDLGVSKGSFYWHFRDRGDLLDKLLAHWEDDELSWLQGGDGASAAIRWARLIERTASPDRIRTEVAVRAWARQDERVAGRVAAIERKKVSLIADVLRDVGFTYSAAESWSEMVWLVCLGWLDRATGDRQFQIAGRALGELLSDVILAASARSPAANR